MPQMNVLRPILPMPQYNPTVINKPSAEEATGTIMDTRPVPAPAKVDDAPVEDSTKKMVTVDIMV